MSKSRLASTQFRSAIQFEWMVALAITLVVVWLDINYARYAGALWRDEANSVSMATYPSLRTTWDRLQFDSFPMFWFVVLRGWLKARFAQTDAGFRVFGLLINLAILAILWLNAWRMSRRPPLIAITLLGGNAAVMMYCGSVRGYGLGLVLGLWMYGAVWAYRTRPTALRWILALVAALLACHTLYYNCIFVGAACIAGATVALWRRQWRVAALILAVGAITAATLLIYIPTFRKSAEWRSMYEYSGGFRWLWSRFVDAITLAGRVMLMYVIAPVIAAIGGFVSWRRAQRAASTGPGEVGPFRHGDLALFGAIAAVLGVLGNILFLRLLNYWMQPWYFLSLMAVIAASADTVHRAAFTGRGARIVGIGLIALLMMAKLFSPLRTLSITRRTNVDHIAQRATELADNEDYIVLPDWTIGISFNRYYRGRAPWQTSPPLPEDAHDIHRSELLFRLLSRPEAVDPVLDTVARTLGNGHRVFYVGNLPRPLPAEQPESYLAKRAESHIPVEAYEIWDYKLHYTLGKLPNQVKRVSTKLSQPISRYEDVQLFMFEGWRSPNAEPAPK